MHVNRRYNTLGSTINKKTIITTQLSVTLKLLANDSENLDLLQRE